MNQSEGNNYQSSHIMGTGDSALSSERPWYILRYKILTGRVKDYLQQHPDNVFFPFRKVSKVREVLNESKDHNYRRSSQQEQYTFKVNVVEQPCIPGYIFMHASIDDALALANELNIFVWRKRIPPMSDFNSAPVARERAYHSVSNRFMRTFREIVTHHRCEMELYDATDIDYEQDDVVEFIKGPMTGKRGYIRITRRKKGGMVIVPIDDSDGSPDDTGGDNAKGAQSINQLCYGIEASPDEYRIVKFANNARNKNCIYHANSMAAELLKAYVQGDDISAKDIKRLKGYLLRYADAEMTTDIQRANIALLIYRIYTILDDDFMRIQHQSVVEGIIQTFDNRVSQAQGWHKEHIAEQKADFIRELHDIAEAPSQRATALASHSATATS